MDIPTTRGGETDDPPPRANKQARRCRSRSGLTRVTTLCSVKLASNDVEDKRVKKREKEGERERDCG